MSVRLPLAAAVVSLAFLPLAPVASAPAAPPAPPPHAVLGTFVRGAEKLTAGTPAALRIATHWATSETATGPWPNVEIEVTMKGGGKEKVVYRGRTDGGGVADARFDVPAWPDGRYSLEVASRAGTRSDRHAHEVHLQPGARLLLESDKPLYQPAQVIHLRAVGLRPQDGKPLAGRDVTFTVADPRGN
ncbi:MAG TPA: hypothetical protein VFF06_10380, partial [Polyangia bacterium]|nr:hypothetical protein [Polyangia bacterium]